MSCKTACLQPVHPRQWFSLTRHHAALAVADRHVAEAFRRHCYTRRGSLGPTAAGSWLTAAVVAVDDAVGEDKGEASGDVPSLTVSVAEGPGGGGSDHAGGGVDEAARREAIIGAVGDGSKADGGGRSRRLLGAAARQVALRSATRAGGHAYGGVPGRSAVERGPAPASADARSPALGMRCCQVGPGGGAGGWNASEASSQGSSGDGAGSDAYDDGDAPPPPPPALHRALVSPSASWAAAPPPCVSDEHYLPTLLASYGLDHQVRHCTA